MGEHIYRLLLQELKIVRVPCKACGAVAECDISRLAGLSIEGNCPFCSRPLSAKPHQLAKALLDFQNAVAALMETKDLPKIEFELRLDREPAQQAASQISN